MPAFTKVSGAWREFNPKVKVGGVWRETAGWSKVAGVWRPWKTIVTPPTGSYNKNGNPALIYLYINADGTWEVHANAPYNPATGRWITGADPTLYDCHYQLTSGTLDAASPSPANTWLPLTASRQFLERRNTAGAEQVVGYIHFQLRSTGTNVGYAPITLTATNP